MHDLAKNLLLVEDNEQNLQLFISLLDSRYDVAIWPFRYGESALEQAKTVKFDIMLLDIGLPEMSGGELLQNIRSIPLNSQTLAIAITSFAMKGDEEALKSYGFDVWIWKPVSVSRYFDTLDRYLQRSPSARPPYS